MRQFAQLWLAILISAESEADFERLGGFSELAKMHDKLAEAPASFWLKRQLRLPDREKLNLWSVISNTTKPQPPGDGVLLQKLGIQFDF